jgi:hypothetical protein
MALKLVQPPENVDRTLWLYELCRFLIQRVNSIIVALFTDNPPCSSITCPEMRASEWQYLCAVHDPPKSCCAIDYCCHTLDWAANTLTSPKHFPSRLALGTDQSTQHSQVRQLTNIFRRVYRIFAHAWFSHRDMFWNVEARTGLYIFFKTVCDYYSLIPEDNYTIPSEAEGIEPPDSRSSMPPLILKREPSEPGPEDSENATIIDGITDHTLSTAGTTKRHRHSPSVGPTAVSTVVEENEEEEDLSKEPTRPVTQLFETTSENSNAVQSAGPEQSTNDPEIEIPEAEPSVPVAPKADPAEDEPEKENIGDEAKKAPTPQIEEKQSDDDENVPSSTDDTEKLDDVTEESKSEDTEKPKEEPTEDKIDDESSTVIAEPEEKSAAKTEEPPAKEEKPAN